VGRKSYISSQANFRSFLYISIRNAAFDYLRHQNVESRYIEEALTANRFLSDDSFQKEEVFRLLFKQIDLLPERCREYSCYIWKVMIMMLLLKNYRCQ
jgi:RNA polymerase sigma-70 factor (ECF subfamily)